MIGGDRLRSDYRIVFEVTIVLLTISHFADKVFSRMLQQRVTISEVLYHAISYYAFFLFVW